ncbi:MAG: caspase family protein, partial [Planctomycetia bacterium]
MACGDQHVEKSLNLPKAVEDMDKFRESLLRTGFKSEDIVYLQGKAGVELRYQPTKLAILEELSLVIKGVNAGDTLVVALNGHGIHPKGAKTSYFVPLDGRIEKEKTLLAMDGEESMFGMLREAVRKKARVLLVVGACRNAMNGNVQALNQMDLEDPSVPPEGIAAIYSCGVG